MNRFGENHILPREYIHSLGDAARRGTLPQKGESGHQGNVLEYRIRSTESVNYVRSSETIHPSRTITETQGLSIRESSRALPRLAEIGERTINSLKNLPSTWRALCRKNGSGRLTRDIVVAGLGASVGAPIVAAAFASWGAETVAMLNQMGAFGVGFLASLVSDWLKKQPESDLTDENTVRAALCDILMAVQSVKESLPDGRTMSESLRHLGFLLAEPVALGMIITIAATDGKNLLELKPDVTDGDASGDAVADDDWLLEEVVEALEDIARQPSMLETTLVQIYISLQNKCD